MKTTTTKLALTALATVLLAAGSNALADDSSVRVIDNHHGAFTYVPVGRQTQTTIGLFANGHGLKAGAPAVKRQELTFRTVSTPHGSVSYFAPAE